MPLRKGNVVADQAAAVEDAPPFDAEDTPAVNPVVEAPAAEAPPPPDVNPVSTVPETQEAAGAAQTRQAAPAREPLPTTHELANKTSLRGPAPVPQAAAPQPPAVRQGSAPMVSGGVTEALGQAGFEGLEFGFGAFPVVTLQNTGQFETSEGGVLGSSFNCILLGSKAKWICKNDQRGDAEDFFYSFDRVTALTGEDAKTIIDGWTQRGWKHEWKKYLDVQAQMVTDDEDNGALVMLSIPPTSINRFSGYVATVIGRYQQEITQVVTRCELGEKVTKVRYPFHPWSFSKLRDI